ncbi:MAG TPA: thiamine pyrophosphate-binding protein, partial [Microbacterium sp.]|nr:thiamine pyrophosphate-binding protein [Microbacterium sp.]
MTRPTTVGPGVAATDPRHRSPATDAAAALLAQLVERGLRHVVLSPGSRSQALALVAAELERRGEIRLHVRIDERVGAFTALGIGRESRMPAAVVCTSGTAVANLLPAVAEAHHAGVPLLLLTADRPPELRGVGANQTTTQPGLFAMFSRYETDVPVPDEVCADGAGEQSRMLRGLADEAVDAALGVGTRSAGPVHLNLPYREPLAGALPAWFTEAPVVERGRQAAHSPVVERGRPQAAFPPVVERARPQVAFLPVVERGRPLAARVETRIPTDAEAHEDLSGALYQGGGGIGECDVPDDPDDAPHLLERGPRTVVIAGADAGPGAEELAHRGGWPLIAEIVSGSRFGRELVHGYRALLRDPQLGGRVERAVVFGHPTLSREATALLSRADVEVVALRGPGEPFNLNGVTIPADAVAPGRGEPDREWLGEWMRAS